MPVEVSEKSIFLNALEMPVGARRKAFVADACAGNQVLQRAVEALLIAHDKEDHFLDTLFVHSPADANPSTLNYGRDQLGDNKPVYVDSYRLREQIGEGGFGLVYVAEQQKPVRRKVALKIIKPGICLLYTSCQG